MPEKVKRNRATPEIGWSPKTKQYVWLKPPNKGGFVPRKVVRLQLDKYLDKKEKEILKLGEALRTRKITAQQFSDRLEKMIRDTNMAGAALGKGGWAQMNQADFGRAGNHIRNELKYARNMIDGINKGTIRLDGRFLNRLKQYSQAPRWLYHHMQRVDLIESGYSEEKSIRHAHDSCSECVILEADGWKKIGTIKLPGSRICLRNCKCTMEYR